LRRSYFIARLLVLGIACGLGGWIAGWEEVSPNKLYAADFWRLGEQIETLSPVAAASSTSMSATRTSSRR
jgi:hypothetical protein